MVAVPFIAAPLLWGMQQQNVTELFLNNKANPSGFPDPNNFFSGLEQNENSTKFQNFSTTTSPSKHLDCFRRPSSAINWNKSEMLCPSKN